MICPHCRTECAEGATRCPACTSWLVEPRPVHEWTRARAGRMLGGVARGLSNRFGLPVAALRLILLFSVLLGGWGILVYAALWIAMPLEPLALPAAPPAAPQPQPQPHGAA
jgi:phage shock protein C